MTRRFSARSPFVLLPLLVIAVFLAWGLYIARLVWVEAGRDEARPADVIVVFGAAEYRGRPSPVLQKRLDHALSLYQRGMAAKIITTGGPGGDPDFTEAGVGRNYLVGRGVPSENILLEDESSSTAQTVVRVAEIMQRHQLHSAVVVSDGYHLFRIKRQFLRKGIEAYGSPRHEQASMPTDQRLWVTVKQVAGHILWKLHIRV